MAITNAKDDFPAAPNPQSPAPQASGRLLPLPLLINNALECLQAGDADGALAFLASAPREARDNPLASRAFPLIYLSANDYAPAIEWFDHGLRVNGRSSGALSGKGTALQGAGRLDEAIACFDEALSLRPVDPETWYNRGIVLDALGDVDEALLSYEAALAQKPDYSRALTRRCLTLSKLGRLEEALGVANSLISAATEDRADGWCLRGNALQELGRYGDAIAAYNQALALRADYPAALINRATALHETGRREEALTDLDTALRLVPEHTEALIARANVLQGLDKPAEAEADYRRALERQPLITHPALKRRPEFRALFIFAPLAGNTPIDDMVSFASFESNMLMLLPGFAYDIALLRSKADVVVNLVSDVDRSREALADVSTLAARLGKPLVNAPSNVLLTDRENVAQLLAGTDCCRVPATYKYTRQALIDGIGSALDISGPLIARVAGTHGGEDMELIGGMSELRAFVAERTAPEFYLSEFVDYRSDDGFFRKYRLIFAGDEILPYHLAIGDTWKVHHASTKMADNPWMQDEEKGFLQSPELVFGDRAFRALRAIQEKFGLDYFGIDCALDRGGRIVIFEVNASMLVHARNARFPYKNGAVARIKAAFATMLKEKAAA